VLLTAERVVVRGEVRANVGIEIGPEGRIRRIADLSELGPPDRALPGRVLLPGFVNAHSHAFQRLLRGRTHTRGGDSDFWSWRQAMYQVASKLTPDSIYIAARQAFIEMLLGGTTTVGEFHYLHHAADGSPYADPSAMGMAVVSAALEAGIRPCMLRTIYLRGDFDQAPEQHQKRFCDANLEDAWTRIEHFIGSLRALGDPRVSWGLAAHSIRAVPIEDLVAIKTCATHLPIHLHAAEQRREVEGCLRKYGVTPIRLFSNHGVLDAGTTLVHATHLGHGEADMIAQAGSVVCICPTTEADLGDGLVPAEDLARLGVTVALGTDEHVGASLLHEARGLEMHERLRLERRNVLANERGDVGVPLLYAATRGGAQALQMDVGELQPGLWADLVSYSLDDPHLSGWDDTSLLPALLFSGDTRAVADVIVGGRFVVQDGVHPLAAASGASFKTLAREIFG
jgi:formimidoylglutamate deiminase